MGALTVGEKLKVARNADLETNSTLPLEDEEYVLWAGQRTNDSTRFDFSAAPQEQPDFGFQTDGGRTIIYLPEQPTRIPPAVIHRESRFEVLQQWEGTVLEKNGTDFTARLQDLTDPSKPEELADILLEEVPDGDLDLIAEGAVFFCTIGYEIANGGQKRRVFEIQFRRLPVWSELDLKLLKEDEPDGFSDFFTYE